jgi:hypothetical protein
MGMDAKAKLWYGVRGNGFNEAVSTEIEEPANGHFEKLVDGVHIDFTYSGDRCVGLGGTLHFAWWAEEEKPVDLDKLPALKKAVDGFLDEYAVEGERGLYLTADFS